MRDKSAISVREMAARLGVSKSQVDRDKQAGMPMHDVEAARAWRLASHDVSRTAEGRIDRPQASGVFVGGEEFDSGTAAAGPRAPSTPSSQPEELATDEHTQDYRRDRARNERIKAEQGEIELARLRNELVSVAEVADLEFTAARTVRDRVEMVPARASADLHALVLTLVPEELRSALVEKLDLYAFERRLSDILREALIEAAQAIEDAKHDDDE